MRTPQYVPIAWTLTWSLASDLGRAALQYLVLDFAPVPFDGLARIAFDAEQALNFSWPAALVGAALVVYLRRRAWPAAVVWLVVSFASAASYPELRAAQRLTAHAFTWTAAMLVVVYAAWESYVVRRHVWRAPQQALGILSSGTLSVSVVVLWTRDPVGDWCVARYVQMVALGLLMVYQVVQLRSRSNQ